MSETLLVELLCEELPPKALKRLGEAFADGIAAGLRKRGMVEGDAAAVRTYATPRRLGVQVDGVKAAADSRPIEVKLMPVAVGLDASGKPTPALAKKLEAAGLKDLDPAKLKRRVDGKAEMLFADATTPAVPLASALQAALDESIAALPIPKVMSYQLADGETTVQFVRPVHGVVALHGAAVVPITALGLASGRSTRGHRFQGAREVSIATARDYEQVLAREGGVMAGFDARRAAILAQLEAKAKEANASLGEAPAFAALLDEVTALVEMPTVYVGEFEREFLEVPAECLVLTMRQNQKYFPLFDAAGKLTSRFLIVSNMRLDDPVNIVQGNERVVRPRLADARFFFDTDRKVKLAERVSQLGSIVYHNKLGTQRERIDRLVKSAMAIQESLPRGVAGIEWAVRAAYLAKADLVTLMVGEFPELQGVMGRYYAEGDGEPPSVARAIEQHYWPRFAGDALPTGDASIAVALADRLDALVGMFSIGQVPTGDKDPFGLRRAALGVVRILMETPLAIELTPLIAIAAKTFRHVPPDGVDALVASVAGFVRERLANLLRERGFTAQEVAAVLELEGAESRRDRLDLVPRKLEAVRQFGKLPEAESLAAANKRIQNILKKSPADGAAADYALLQLPEEKKLRESLAAVTATVTAKLAANDFAGTLTALASLRGPVDTFFEKVLVNAEDAKLRAARLGLLNDLGAVMNKVADISKLSS
jgi:glycyl-tRNA synthetase beta chain